MKRPTVLGTVLLLVGLLLAGANGCSSDPNVEGAKLDLRNQDYDRALENVEEALANNPDNAEALALKVEILQGKLTSMTDPMERRELVEEMRATYERAINLEGADAEALTQRMRIAYVNEFQKGIDAFNADSEDNSNYDRAVAFFDNTITIMPDSAGPYVNKAYALINSGQQAEAIEPMQTAIDMGEDQPDSYIYLASLYRMEGENEDAILLLQDARTKYPDNADIQSELLNAYVAADRADEAMPIYEEAVAREPDNPLYRFNYGTLLLNADMFDEAIEQLGEAARLDPSDSNIQYNLGAAFTNKAFGLNAQISELDDQLREQRDEMSAAEIQAMEEQMDTLAEQRAELFNSAIPPLEQAREILQTEGGNVQPICQALFQAYVQTRQDDNAREVADCAGVDIN